MSKFYRVNNQEGSRELYEKRLIYNLNAKTKTYHKHLVDFTFAEKALYGRVDRLYYAIVPKSNVLKLRQIKTKDGQNSARVINFVADAFEEMAMHMQKKLLANEISRGEDFLSGLVAYSAYKPPEKAYNDYLKIYMDAFEEIVKDNRIRFKDFDEFVRRIMPYIKEGAKKNPFTYPGFIKSTRCPMECSGLVIKISNLKFSGDDKKFEKMYNSKNWEYFVNLTAAYGFMIDRNNPSRIVADIASPEMMKYAERYNIRSTDHVLKEGFAWAHTGFISTLRNVLFRMYNRYKVKQYNSHVYVSPTRKKIITIKPAVYTIQDLKKQYNDQYFINLYCKIRFLEEESEFREDEKFRITDNTIELSEGADKNTNKALNSFEMVLNKTFDYRGSLSYHNMRLKKLRE